MADASAPESAQPDALILHQISIRHYRSLYSVGPIALQDCLTVVAGQNDGGKSAFLEALAFLLDRKSADKDDRWSACDDEDEIVVEGLLYGLKDDSKTSPVRIRARQCPPSAKVLEIAERVHNSTPAGTDSMTVQQLRDCCQSNGLTANTGTLKADLVGILKNWITTRPQEEFLDVWRPM